MPSITHYLFLHVNSDIFCFLHVALCQVVNEAINVQNLDKLVCVCQMPKTCKKKLVNIEQKSILVNDDVS